MGRATQPANIKMTLQELGNAKDAAERIMGRAIIKGWRLVNLPFQPEYPGGRRMEPGRRTIQLPTGYPGT